MRRLSILPAIFLMAGMFLSLHAQPALTTTTTLGVGPSSSVPFEQPVTLTATVTDSNSMTVVHGTVTFYDGTTLLGTSTLISSASGGFTPGTAIFRTRILAQTSHSLTATFNGTAADQASTSSAQSLTITAAAGPYPSATIVTETTGTGGSGIGLSATVGGFGPFQPTGSVNFNDLTQSQSVGSASVAAGSMGFLPSTISYSGHTACSSVAVAGDFNNDGDLDVVTAGATVGSDGVCGDGAGLLTSFLGNGAGGFTAAASSAALSSATSNSALVPYAVAVGDFNEDGNLDVVVSVPSGVLLFLGNGDGTFQAGQSILTTSGSPAIAVADFNGDGAPDLAAAVSVDGIPQISTLLGNGNGTFQAAKVTTWAVQFAAGQPWLAMTAGVVNGTGNVDLWVCTQESVALMVGNADGTFQMQGYDEIDYSVDLGEGVSAAMADLANNGDTDLIWATTVGDGAGHMNVWTWAGTEEVGTNSGPYDVPADVNYAEPQPVSIAIGDYNYDGNSDVALYDNISGRIDVYTGNGDGTLGASAYAAPQEISVPGSPLAVNQMATGDFRNDGNFGLVVVDAVNQNLDLLEPAWTGTATPASVTIPSSSSAQQIDAVYGGDMNFAGSTSPALTIAPAKPAPSLTLTNNLQGFTGVVQGMAVTFTATAAGGSGMPAPTGTVQFSLSSGGSGGEVTLSGGTGSYTFQTSEMTTGNYSMTATYSGDANYGPATATFQLGIVYQGSSQLNITPASTSVTEVVAGAPLTFTATLQPFDYGPTPTGTVTFVNSPPGGGTITLGTATLSATAPYPATFVVNTAANPLPQGTNLISTNYSGSSSWGPSGGGGAYVDVQMASTTTTVTTSAANAGAGTSVTLTAAVASSATTLTPTGTVQFYDGTTALGTPAALSSGTATYTTTSLAAGAHSITAVYSGDTNFTTSTSAALTETIVSIAVSGSAGSGAVNPGGAETYTVSVTSQGGVSESTSFACTGLPTGAACSFSPQTVSGTGTTTLTISTTGSSAATLPNPLRLWTERGAPVLACVVLLMAPARRRRQLLFLLLIALVPALAVGCGGGGNGGGGGGGGNNGTPAGTYTVTVTSTTGSGASAVTATATVTLTVQ